MAMSPTLQRYLEQAGVEYDVIPHPHTSTNLQSAQAAHVPGAQVAKPVIFEDDDGYLMAVVPADCSVDAEGLKARCHRPLVMAQERELRDLFTDCERGAIPPIGQAYGLNVVWDDRLSMCPDVYFEAGDHTDLVHVKGGDFRALMGNQEHAPISSRAA